MSDGGENPVNGWATELERIEARRQAAAEMGGADKVAIQHAKGKLTVLERIDQLLDADSFREIGTLAGLARYADDGGMQSFTPANLRFGWGRIEGRPVVVSGDDFTVRGGAADAAIHEKLVQAEQMANEFKMPIVRLLDGSGGGGSVKTLEQTGHTYVPELPGWDWLVNNLATVPVVSLGLGPIAGLGAARLVSSHYSLLLTKQGQMFAAGPSLVAAIGQNVTKEELGGASLHAQIGSIDDLAEDENEAFAKARRFLSYLPSSVDALPARIPSEDPTQRAAEELDSIVPRDRRQAYKMRRVLECVLDAGSFFEIGRHWGRASITGLARLDGWPVAVIASDPNYYGGAWTADTAQKLVRFIELAETFHLPVVHLRGHPRIFWSACRQSARVPYDMARVRSRACIKRLFPGAPSSSARRLVWRVRACAIRAVSVTDARGHRATGGRCRSKEASRRHTSRSLLPPPIRWRSAARSKHA